MHAPAPRISPLFLAVTALLLGPAAQAQTAEPTQPPAAPPQAPAPTGNLPTVTISSGPEKGYVATESTPGILGDLKIVDTPFSVNVLNRALIENQQAAHYGDYLKNDPSVNIGNVPVGFVNIRGFAVGTDGFLYDGLPGASPLSDGRYQLNGFDRIEVLKGASSFLYGVTSSSSIGGVLNFIPKRAPDTPVRHASIGYTSQSLIGLNADLGDRFGADRQFGYRLNLGVKSGEQAVDGTDWRHRSASLALDWRVTPDLVLSGAIEQAYNRFPTLQPFFFLNPGFTVPPAPNLRRNLAQPWDDFAVSQAIRYVRADSQLSPDWSLTGQAMHARNDRPRFPEARFGALGGAAPGDVLLFGSEDESKTSANTGQLTLRGKFVTGGIGHQLSASVLTSRSKSSDAYEPLDVFPSNIYNPVSYPAPPRGNAPLLPSQRSRSDSVAVSDIVKWNERWSSVLGLRHVRIERENTGSAPTSQSKNTPVVALIFKPRNDLSVYANYAEGLEQGGEPPNRPGTRLPPLATKQVEVGVKWEAGRTLWTAALFDMRRPLEVPDGNGGLVQTGQQRHRGLELTGNGQLDPNLALVTGLTLLDPKATQTGDPATEGRRPVGVPRQTGSIFVDYRLAALPGWSVNGGLYAVASQFLDGANLQRVPGFVRTDAGVRYETRIGGAATVWRLNIENLANKNYWAGGNTGILTLADPRTVKLSASFDL